MQDKFLKPYDHTTTEDRLYTAWLQADYFNPDTCIVKGITKPDAPHFSIVLPPPNVTGNLHLGHSAMLAIEDIMVRFNRMQGKKTLWLPGTDHAAIATQSKVEGIIYKAENKRRHDLGREELLRRITAYAEESRSIITNQVKKMGASVDWSREAFTLDEKRTQAVFTAFKQMHDDGLIYRKNRIVNWDPKGQTTISDDEIVYIEEKTKLYTFKYSKDFPISISTTRPETKVGDTAVAVHPEDARYKKYIGKTFSLTFLDVPIEIKVVADEVVDPNFGTGAVGITPSHSMTDADIAARHNLPEKQVINEYAKMSVPGVLNGKKVAEARTMVIEWLKTEGLLEKEEDLTHNIATAERTGGIIEPLPKLQWFVAVDKPFAMRESNLSGIKKGDTVTLKQLMLHAVRKSGITILPDRFESVYFNWIENLRDWCISRQIWYGHRIPVWYKDGDMQISLTSPGEGYVQDEDTLDTWFSSGLWTFSTLGWPDMTADFKTYHPTTIIETGYDIIFFWVARMILMSTYLLGDIPFKTVYLHGLVRDAKGQKFSKSLGNGIDPLDIITKYGADALRMALIVGAGPGNDVRFSEDKAKGYKHFANKLWNITRFVLQNTEGITYDNHAKFNDTDTALLTEFNTLFTEITKEIEEYKFHLVAEKLYAYAWHRLADQILEESKSLFREGGEIGNSRGQALLHILRKLIISLHPFMPFVTEEIWAGLPEAMRGDKMLIVTPWETPKN